MLVFTSLNTNIEVFELLFPIYSHISQLWFKLLCFIIHMGVGTGGAKGARAPPIILPSEIFLTQYALLSMKLAHKLFIFNKIFRLASLANQDTSN